MEWEWPAWKLVIEKGIPLSEIKSWSLVELYKALDFAEMQNDYENAYHEFENEKYKNKFGNK